MRAVAAAPAVLSPASPSAVPGGYVGVDVFFAISGLLMGTAATLGSARRQGTHVHNHRLG